jgi:glucuronosyltransferase
MEIGKALSRLPVKVLWKLSKREIPDDSALQALKLGDNVKVGTRTVQL